MREMGVMLSAFFPNQTQVAWSVSTHGDGVYMGNLHGGVTRTRWRWAARG